MALQQSVMAWLLPQNRSLNLLLEKERTKVAKLQQALSQASPAKQASSVVSLAAPSTASDSPAGLSCRLTKRMATPHLLWFGALAAAR